MCVEVIAVPSQTKKVGARALAEASGLSVTKVNEPLEGGLHFAREGGCSCTLMAEPVDPHCATWVLDSAVVGGLTKALEMIGLRAKGFTFQAVWRGEEATGQETLSVKQFLRRVRENKIKNGCVYRVGRAG
jgi:hypothetical protein